MWERKGQIRFESLGKYACILLMLCAAGCTSNQQSAISEPDVLEFGSVTTDTQTPLTAEVGDEKQIRKLRFERAAGFDFNSRCRSKIAGEEFDAQINNYPNLIASVDKEGDGQVLLSYDLLNVKNNQLNLDLAYADCRVRAALAVARTLQKASARGLGREGMLARVSFINGRKGRFAQIRKILNEGVSSGKIKDKSRQKVFKSIAKLEERTVGIQFKARGQDKIDLNVIPSFVELEHELMAALEAQHQLQVESDYYRNFRLSVSGGYTFEDDEDDDRESYEYEGFAGAQFQVRLGVFSPQWRRKQGEKFEAVLDGLYEPNVGALWRVKETYRKNGVSLSALGSKRAELSKKVSVARKKRSALEADDTVGRILLEIEIIALRAELIEIETNLRNVNSAQRKLVY